VNERRYGVLIASSRFDHEPNLPALRCPENDVDGLYGIISSELYGDFDASDVSVVKNEPSYEVLRRLNQALKRAGKEDLVLIYYSGHGKPDTAGRLHLATCDTVIESLESTSIPVERIKSFVDVSACNKVILILDCCYSGAAGDAFFRGAAGDQLQHTAGGRGIYILTASTKLQLAQEKEGDRYGLLTKHIITGIQGGNADRDRDGIITMDELYNYVHDKVLEESAQEPEKYSLRVRGELIIARTGPAPQLTAGTPHAEAGEDLAYGLQAVLPGHHRAAVAFAFSPRGKTLASATGDGQIHIWEVASAFLKQTLNAHAGAVWGLTFTPDGRALISAGADKTLRIWGLPGAGAVLQHALPSGEHGIMALAAHPGAPVLASAGYNGKIQVWDLSSGDSTYIADGSTAVIHALQFSPSGELLASAGAGKSIQLWDANDGTLKRTLNWHSNTVFSLSFSKDGQWLASAGRDCKIKLWDASGSWAPGRTLKAHNHTILSVAFHPSSLLLASGGGDDTIRLWGLKDGRLLQTIESGHGSVHCLGFSPDGELFVSGGSDPVMRVWKKGAKGKPGRLNKMRASQREEGDA
jgi:WD40 repeat protein